MVQRISGGSSVSFNRIPPANVAVNSTRAPQSSNSQTLSNSITAASYHEQFVFPDDERELDIGAGSVQSEIQERPNRQLLIELFLRVVVAGIIIVPSPPRGVGNAIIEASLVQDPTGKTAPQLKIPLRGIVEQFTRIGYTRADLREQIIACVDLLLSSSSDKEIERLIIITAHEYGHYLSYKAGNHTKRLAKALRIFRSRKFGVREINDYLKLVFQEEVSAWRFGAEQLRELEFSAWERFEGVKSNSLATYADLLRLNELSVVNTCSLSFSGKDFQQAIKQRARPAQFSAAR